VGVKTVHVISMPQVNLLVQISMRRILWEPSPTYCNPIRLHVSRIIRTDSVVPLTDGEPLHDATDGI
jgi:hypothetical protein